MSYLIALLAGAASVLAFAPFDQFWLMPLSWAVIYGLLANPGVGGGRAFLLGWAWGSGSIFAGMSWLVVALNRFGGLSLPLSIVLIVLFCCAQALHSGVAGWIFARLRPALWWQRALLMAACWTLAEILRGQVSPACSWVVMGYSQTPPSPLAGWAPVLGVYGVSFLLALFAGLLVEAWQQPAVRRRAIPLALAIVAAGAGLRRVAWTEPVGEPVKVALIQTNIPQDQKWLAETVMHQLQMNVALLQRYPAQLMVMPESSLPLFVQELPEGYTEVITQQAKAAGGDAIVGVFTGDMQGGIHNSAVSFGKSPSQVYSKNHLVPFGEFRPWGFGWFFDIANIPMANQARGGDHQAPMLLAGQKVALNICYEDGFGEELRSALPEATLMLNLSNMAWYGDSHAQPQHLQMSQMRALESGRPQLRSTNTGMTGVVNADGTVAEVMAPFTQGAVLREVRGYQGLTPFILLGDWPVKVVVLLVLAWGLWLRLRGRAS